MTEAENLFSESWHLVAPLRVMLRPDLEVQRQVFRGESWWVVQDRMNRQFFRLRPAAYRFIARLDGRRTVEEVWRDGVNRAPEETPGQQEIVQLIAQLAGASLIQGDLAGDSLRQFARRRRERSRLLRTQALNFLFIRIPLFDPDPLLTRLAPVWRAALGRAGLVAWIAGFLFALKLAAENWGELWDSGQGVLAPANLGWLYLVSVVLKLWHELGHGAFCKRFGGEVRTFGVMLMVLLPLPYIDATAAYAFRERHRRVLTGAGGMIFEFFAASVAMIVWANTGPGLVHQLAYNLIFLASVSTLLFNLNPLLRFDGYFILCDLVDTPNLAQRATRHLRYLVEHHAFRLPRLVPVEPRQPASGLVAAYGIASAVYRVWVLWIIILFLGDSFYGLGLILAVGGAILWLALPVVRTGRYLLTDPRLETRRPRVLAISGATLAAVLLLLTVVPFPNRFQTPGVVRSHPATAVVAGADGTIAEVFAVPGAAVVPGQPLLRLDSPLLEARRRGLMAAVEEAEARLRYAREAMPAQLPALDRQLAATRTQLQDVERRREGLLLRAPHAGRWATGGMDFPVGLFIPRGVGLGEVVAGDKFIFTAIVSQEDASWLFSDPIRRVRVRLAGEAGTTVDAPGWRILPGDQRRLPTAALGWEGGGVIAVDGRDNQATQTTEPFFEVSADFPPAAGVTLLHLRGGQAKFSMQPRPLAVQWWRQLRQLLQKRYQI